MGIPIIQEIFDGLRWLIDFFLNKVPKPIKFLIFLLFLLLFGSIISFMLHFSGIHCNSDKQVVKVPFIEVGTNLNLIWETSERTFTSETLTVCDAHPEKCGRESECYFYAQELDSGYYVNCNSTNSTSECLYYLKQGSCHTCDNQEICFQDSLFGFFCGDWHNICLDNAYPSDYSASFDSFSGCGDSCYIPDNYLWNQTNGIYECANDTYCGDNPTIEANPVIDEKLMRVNAKLIYADDKQDKSYKRTIYLKCDKNFNPVLTFFGIPIFDYKIWLFLIVIYILGIVLLQIKK